VEKQHFFLSENDEAEFEKEVFLAYWTCFDQKK
jgi:hypothetical protein